MKKVLTALLLLILALACPAHSAGPKGKVEKIAFASKALDKPMMINIYTPPDYNPGQKYPVLYLLHGSGGNNDSWFIYHLVNRAADKLLETKAIQPLIIVAPNYDTSWGINSREEELPPSEIKKYQAGRYEDYLYKEVIPYIDSHYSTISDRSGRWIGGFSMGGFAALHLAFTYPQSFSRVGGHSPAIWDEPATNALLKWLYPSEAIRRQRDPLQLARWQNLSNTAVWLDCGDKDQFELYEGCAALQKTLEQRGVKSEYHLFEGGHDNGYVKTHARDYLLFYTGVPKN